MPERRRNSRRQRLGSEGGFTLIEVLVAAMVLVVGILGTAKLAASSESTTLDAELHQVATEQAERVLEEARSLDYAEVGNTVAPTQQPNGSDALAGGQFTPPGSDEPEELITPATGGSSGALIPVRNFTVDQGGGRTVRGTIYTYASWRNEDCGGLSLLNNPTLSDTVTQLENLQTQLGITQAKIVQALPKLTGGLIGLLPEAGTLKAELNELNDEIADALPRLQAKIDELNDLVSAGADVDLCDISTVVFDQLSAVLDFDTSDISVIVGDLTNPDAINDSLDDLINSSSLSQLLTYLGGVTCSNPLTRPLCIALVQPILNNVVNPLLTALDGSGPTAPTDLIDALSLSLDGLPAIDSSLLGGGPNSDRNTKRVSVAVTIDSIARQDVGPRNPVWLSTVITDPRDGLLGLSGSP